MSGCGGGMFRFEKNEAGSVYVQRHIEIYTVHCLDVQVGQWYTWHKERVMDMTVTERIAALRRKMDNSAIDACLIVTDDFHGSEYVGAYFKTRAFLSGFTGSAGSLLVMAEEAYLWTDGRYFLQAEQQLRDSGIQLMRAGQPGVPTLSAFLAEKMAAGGTLGFDGRTVSTQLYRRLEKALAEKNVRLEGGFDPAEGIWTDRPGLSAEAVWAFHSGVTRREKLELLRGDMAKTQADHLLLTDLTDVAWTLELRGGDVACTPVFLGFLLIGRERAVLCAQERAFSAAVREELAADGVTMQPYEDIYRVLAALPQGARVMADEATANSRIAHALARTEWQAVRSPASVRKAVKSAGEQEGFRAAHLQDGAALCRFLCRVKKHPEAFTEVSAGELLHRLRAEGADFVEDSFDTIAAYGAHGAVVHYSATAETDVALQRRGLLLLDSGGHYRCGTTDVTRTFALGDITARERQMATLVLRGHIQLAMARFPKGVCGENLDALARMPLWREGVDFDHGTGHGVGCVLSVHESPPSFRWRIGEGATHPALEAGMVISDEPGYYEAGVFGIRHENLLLVQEAEQEGFLRFEVLTLVPFDRDALDAELLSPEERAWLNAYHRRVREQIAPLVDAETREWLAGAAAEI